MLLALLVLTGLAVAQPRSEWMDELDPESAYLSIISLTKQVESSVNSTQNEMANESETEEENEGGLPPPPPPSSEPETDRQRPPGPWPPRPRSEDRCGKWNTWQQAKCWWPDQPLDQLPPACSAIPTKARWPEWMKMFVVAKAMEKYSMLMDEYKTRGAPPKCGRCTRSFECRMRNETSSRRDFCPSKQIRPMFNVDCDDHKACEVTQEKGGCPPPLFLGGRRRERLQQMIKDENHEGFAKELWNMQGNDNNRRQKRQVGPNFDEPAPFMPFDPQFDFPYETGRREYGQGRRPFGPSGDFPQPQFRPSASDNNGYSSFDAFSYYPRSQFRPRPPGPPRHVSFGPTRDFSRPPFRHGPFGPRPRGPFEPSNFPMPPFQHGPLSPPARTPFAHPGDFPTPLFRSGPFEPQGRGLFGPSNDFPQPPFRPPPGGPGSGPIRPSQDFPIPPISTRPFGRKQPSQFKPSDDFSQLNFHPGSSVRRPFGPSNDFPPPPFHAGIRGSPFQSQRLFGPGMSASPTFSMMWARPMSFPNDAPRRPPVGPQPHHRFLFDLFHGTTCASSGKKCLCCCGHFIPNVETGDCEDLRQLLPGIEKMVENVLKPSQPSPPSEKFMRQSKEFFRKQMKSN